MSALVNTVESYWKWTGLYGNWVDEDIDMQACDPLSCPEFERLKQICISSINQSLSRDEINAFLFCMALDTEDEHILDACRELATVSFVSDLLQIGVTCAYAEARWQMAELLRMDIPKREQHLRTLLYDSDFYVRKRTHNVIDDISKDAVRIQVSPPDKDEII